MNIYENGTLKYKLEMNFDNFSIPNIGVENLIAVPVPRSESTKYFPPEQHLCLIFVYDEDTRIFTAFGRKYPEGKDLMELLQFMRIGICPSNVLMTEISDEEYNDLYNASVKLLNEINSKNKT